MRKRHLFFFILLCLLMASCRTSFDFGERKYMPRYTTDGYPRQISTPKESTEEKLLTGLIPETEFINSPKDGDACRVDSPICPEYKSVITTDYLQDRKRVPIKHMGRIYHSSERKVQSAEIQTATERSVPGRVSVWKVILGVALMIISIYLAFLGLAGAYVFLFDRVYLLAGVAAIIAALGIWGISKSSEYIRKAREKKRPLDEY